MEKKKTEKQMVKKEVEKVMIYDDAEEVERNKMVESKMTNEECGA